MKTRIWQHIREQNLLQKNVAGALRIHFARLSQICNGAQPTKVETQKLCRFFDKDEAELFAPAIWKIPKLKREKKQC